MKYARYWMLPLLLRFGLAATAQPQSHDSLLAIIRGNKGDTAEAHALNRLAGEYTRTDLAQAITLLHRAVTISIRNKDTLSLTHAYNQLVTCQVNTGKIDSAQYFLTLLKKTAEGSTSPDILTDLHSGAGLFYKIQGNYKAALPYLLASLDDATRIAHKEKSVNATTYLAGQYLNIGNTYGFMADYRSALAYHLKGLHLFEEVKNNRGISFCYQGIGSDFLEMGQFAQATFYTQKAIALKTEAKDQRGIETALKQQGSIFRGEKRYDSCLTYYFQSLKIIQAMSLKIDEADMEFDIGNVYGDKADLPNARIFLSNSKTVARDMGDSSRFKRADAALLSLQGRLDREHRDEVKLISSLQASVESGDRKSELANYQYLSDHYAGIKQYDKALYYARRYYEMNDSLQGREVQLQLKRLESQYNVEKQEKEIVLLKEDQQLSKLLLQRHKVFQVSAGLVMVLLVAIGAITINRNRVVSNARRLVEMEKMRNNIARDLHDDIGSTLTSINVLSTVALEPQSNGFMVSSMQKIKDRSQAIMEKMDDIVWAINPQNDTMEELLARMKEFAAEILEPMNVNYRFEEKGDFASVRLDIRRRKDLYLLFKEAVNNAAKYSQCANLTIRLQQEQGSLQMEISDDGKGFVEELVRGGNGLNNMRERAASMDGRIRIQSAVGAGTRIVLDAVV